MVNGLPRWTAALGKMVYFWALFNEFLFQLIFSKKNDNDIMFYKSVITMRYFSINHKTLKEEDDSKICKM